MFENLEDQYDPSDLDDATLMRMMSHAMASRVKAGYFIYDYMDSLFITLKRGYGQSEYSQWTYKIIGREYIYRWANMKYKSSMENYLYSIAKPLAK